MEHFLNWDGAGKLYEIGNTAAYGWLCTSGMPLRGADGEICAFALADVSLENVAGAMKGFVFQYIIAISIATVLLGYFLTRHMKKTLVAPINAIAEAAQNYAADRRAGVSEADHFALLNIRTGDEVENLSLIMADMEHDLAAYEEHLTKVTAEKERINTELSLATRIQANMLPNIFPAFPERTEFDLFALMNPAKEVGGDFFDFFLTDEDHLCMIIADVSGKGVPAALFMMASKIILANNAMMGKRPAQILEDTNTSICKNNREDMFITIWLGILEISTGKLTAVNAGHEYPAIMHKGGEFELYKDRHGFVVGAMDGLKYKEYEIELEPGAKIFLYTDGVPEADNEEKKMFGAQRMLEVLNRNAGETPAVILANTRAAIRAFAGKEEQFDDITMLCLEYKGRN